MKTTPGSSQEDAKIYPEAFQARWRNLDRRQWWLWPWTFLVLMLLTVAAASFTFPALLAKEESIYSFYFNQAVRALVGMLLIFCVYPVYQQTVIVRMRNQLSSHKESLAKVENLANEIYKLAALDQLTGLCNRRSGEQRLEQEIKRAMRYKHPLTVLLLDLDGLKQVNDGLGHGAGDTVLQAFSGRLLRAIRASDFAVRLGGDEFMVLLPECRADEVNHVLGRLEGLVVEYNGEKIPCRFSRGWTDYKSLETTQEFLQRADEALYTDKRAGKQQSTSLERSPITQPAS
jgi:diguanylate cyclase (GGDEF)-like protein